MQQAGLRPCPDVLEGKRWAMEELERPDPIRDLDERDREVEGVTDQGLHGLLGDVPSQQMRADGGPDRDEIRRLQTSEGRGR
jgi:hypothetical protein